jgi:hypothetical protein
VSVLTQPVGQTCVVGNGAGAVDSSGDNISIVTVTCTVTSSVGGTVAGLASGNGVWLANNGQLPGLHGVDRAGARREAPCRHRRRAAIRRAATVAGANRFASTEELADAMKTLLAALTQSQQQTADDLLPRLLRLTSASGQRIGAR